MPTGLQLEQSMKGEEGQMAEGQQLVLPPIGPGGAAGQGALAMTGQAHLNQAVPGTQQPF